MAMTESQVVALELEKVRKKIPLLYERADTLFSMLQKRDVMKVSNRAARIPLQTAPGGAFGYASLDGGDLGRGSGTLYNVATISPIGVRYAVEINKLVEYVTNSGEKAVADATKLEVVNAMKQFRRDLDAQLQTAGNGVMATVDTSQGTINTPAGFVPLAKTPFGARLIRPFQKLLAYDTTLTTPRVGTMVVQSVSNALGATQSVIVDTTAAGLINTDVLVPEGLAGANPVGLWGIPYHHNNSTSGSWMGLSRLSNTFAVAALVNANSSGLAMPFIRLAIDTVMQQLGIEEVEAMNQLKWYGHRAQRAAYHEIALSISRIEKSGGDQSFDLAFGSSTMDGIQAKWAIHADPTRLDLLNLETWGRVEWKEIDYLEIGGETVFPVYGVSGGIAAAYLFYFVSGLQFFVDNPKACTSIINLAVPQGYV